jgi:hypothetical protein
MSDGVTMGMRIQMDWMTRRRMNFLLLWRPKEKPKGKKGASTNYRLLSQVLAAMRIFSRSLEDLNDEAIG